MSEYAIKSFDKLPERVSANKSRYPFAEMTEGQKFFVPFVDGKDISKNILSAATTAGRKLGKKFSGRTIVEDGTKGFAVYCVKS